MRYGTHLEPSEIGSQKLLCTFTHHHHQRRVPDDVRCGRVVPQGTRTAALHHDCALQAVVVEILEVSRQRSGRTVRGLEVQQVVAVPGRDKEQEQARVGVEVKGILGRHSGWRSVRVEVLQLSSTLGRLGKALPEHSGIVAERILRSGRAHVVIPTGGIEGAVVEEGSTDLPGLLRKDSIVQCEHQVRTGFVNDNSQILQGFVKLWTSFNKSRRNLGVDISWLDLSTDGLALSAISQCLNS